MLRIGLLSLLLSLFDVFPAHAKEPTLAEKIRFIRENCSFAEPSNFVLVVWHSADEYGGVCEITIRSGGYHFTAYLPKRRAEGTPCQIHISSGLSGKGPLHETRYIMSCQGEILVGDEPKVAGYPDRKRLIHLMDGSIYGLEHKPYWDEEIRKTVDFFTLALLHFQRHIRYRQ